jgi:hypothetical protein
MPILKAPCLISYPRTKFSSSFPQNSLLKMANRRQVRNHLQIGGNLVHYHVHYCPFQTSEVPGTLVAWLTGQDLAIGDVKVGLPCSCDDQEGMHLAGLARQGLFRHRKAQFLNKLRLKFLSTPSTSMEATMQTRSHELNFLSESPLKTMQPFITKRMLIKYLPSYRILLRQVQPQPHRHERS